MARGFTRRASANNALQMYNTRTSRDNYKSSGTGIRRHDLNLEIAVKLSSATPRSPES